MSAVTYAVIGGGITGLAAAWELSAPGSDPVPLRPGAGSTDSPDLSGGRPRVVVIESSERLGGKIDRTNLDGQSLEAGPDAFLARIRAAVDLCSELGLTPELISPATGKAYLWTRGCLRAIPANSILGVPARPWSLARAEALSVPGRLRAELDLVLRQKRTSVDTDRLVDTGSSVDADRLVDTGRSVDADRSVGEIVRARFGSELADAVVGPIIGGIHAGDIDRLSLAATAPAIDTARRSHRSLMWALRRQLPPASKAPSSPDPIFLAPRAGLSRLVESLTESLVRRGVEIVTGAPVKGLSRQSRGWEVATGGRGGPIVADGVILCTPAPETARLIGAHSRPASDELARITYASVCLASLSWPLDALARPLDGSGFLVPANQGRLMTACTWTSTKWPHLATPGRATMRASAGRFGDTRAIRMDDQDIVATLSSELVEAGVLRREAARPLASVVNRWPESFPQYEVGHLERVARIEAQVSQLGGLAVAGAALRGVGIPACVESGRRAGRILLDYCSSPVTGRGP